MIRLLVGIALFYVLIKIPFWVLGSIRGKPGFVGSLIRGIVAYKTLGVVGGLGRRLRTGKTRSAVGEEGAPDPYAKARTDARGQYLLPFEGLKRQKPVKPPHQRHAPKRPRTGRQQRGPDRQMMLPMDGEWPENKAVLQRDGQYRLAMPVERHPRRPAPSQPPPEQRAPSGRSRQMSLPLGKEWPENRLRWPAADRHGQYRLPLRVRRQPRPQPPPAPPEPKPGPDRQLSLIELPPKRWPRADRHGQYPLPLDVQRQPRPAPPPVAPEPPRPRRRPHPQLPLHPRPRRSRPRRSSGGPS